MEFYDEVTALERKKKSSLEGEDYRRDAIGSWTKMIEAMPDELTA